MRDGFDRAAAEFVVALEAGPGCLAQHNEALGLQCHPLDDLPLAWRGIGQNRVQYHQGGPGQILRGCREPRFRHRAHRCRTRAAGSRSPRCWGKSGFGRDRCQPPPRAAKSHPLGAKWPPRKDRLAVPRLRANASNNDLLNVASPHRVGGYVLTSATDGYPRTRQPPNPKEGFHYPKATVANHRSHGESAHSRAFFDP